AVVGVPRASIEDAFYVGGIGEKLGLDVLPMWIARRNLEAGNVTRSAAAAADLGKSVLNGGKVGIEMPFLPAAGYAALQSALPHAQLVDATDLLHELRAIKTEAELSKLGEVSEKVAGAIRDGFRAGRNRTTTREVAAAVEKAMGERGLAFLWAFTNAGPGYVRAPSDIKWERGRLMHLDCGGEEGDYLADICRMGSLGEPSALGREL